MDIKPEDYDKLNVSWQANSNDSCPATEYLVTYELIRVDQCREGDRSGGSLNVINGTSTTIEGLQAYSEYRINVTSRNEAGKGTTQTSSEITGEFSKCN